VGRGGPGPRHQAGPLRIAYGGLCLGVSKAFTRESDEARTDEFIQPRPQTPPGGKRYITRQGADRLRQEAMVLLQEKRSVSRASSGGSGESTAKVRRIEAAIQRIEEALASAIVTDPSSDTGKAGFGASIRIRDQNGEEETYQIVGPDEAEPGQGRISSISPLARALMNSRPGETVRFKSPAGEQELAILSVQY